MAMSIVQTFQYTGGLHSGVISFNQLTQPGNIIVVCAFNFTGPTNWVTPDFIHDAGVDGLYAQVPYWQKQGNPQGSWGSIIGSGCAADILYKVTAGGSDGFRFSADGPVLIQGWEISGVNPNLDDFQISGSGVFAPVLGAALSGVGANDFCVNLLSSAINSPTSISAPWNLGLYTVSMQGGPAYLLNANGTQAAPTWTEVPGNTDTYVALSVAFGLGTPQPNFPAPPGGDRFIPKPSLLAGPVQNIPLDNSPNQVWRATVLVNNKPVTIIVTLRYNEIAQYWVATIRDGKNNLLLDSLPFVTGDGVSQNLLSQFAYLGIGSATVFNASQLA